MLAISTGLLIATSVLCVFHFYLSLFVDLTTLDFYQSEDTVVKQDSPKETGEFFVSHNKLQS
jgi:hypothetical protein